AHLDVGTRAQALADHRRQAALAVDAEVSPQVHRPRAEIVRIDQRGQRQHVVAVSLAQFDDLRAGYDLQRRIAGHLRQVAEGLQRPARWQPGRCDTEQQDRLARRHQLRQRSGRVGIGAGHAQERRELGGIARHVSIAQGHGPMPGRQRRPEGVVEGVWPIHGRDYITAVTPAQHRSAIVIPRHQSRRPDMSYIDGCVIAVPDANRGKFIEYARQFDPMFIEFGAIRVIECWGDDVPDGKVTDFRRAVQAKEGESVVFSWIEWPDKATRDAGMEKMMKDPRMDMEKNPMPYDGKRMIYGGFAPVFELA